MANQRTSGGIVAALRRHNELVSRILFLLGALLVYRIGSHIPVPGINSLRLQELFSQNENTLLSVFNTFSGGALERLSIMALGIMPYISAAIIIQMMTAVVPSLEALKKEGESGQRKISQYTRQGTLFLAILQAIGISAGLQSSGLTLTTGMSFMLPAVISLATGTMFLMWLGEQITERGVGNGISMLIFASIIASMPSIVLQSIESLQNGQTSLIALFVFAVIVILVSAGIVYVERAQRKVPVHYAQKQQMGRKVFPQQRSHLPLKLNMASVIPAIFASSILLVPSSIAQWSGAAVEPSLFQSFLQGFVVLMSPGQPLYLLVYGSMIIFFCYFYTALVFSPKDVAENLKRSGAFVPGIRPGLQTQRYLDHLMTRITFIGAIYMTVVCVAPMVAGGGFSAFYIGSIGVSLLIAIVVLMDFIAQVQNHLVSHRYDGESLINL